MGFIHTLYIIPNIHSNSDNWHFYVNKEPPIKHQWSLFPTGLSQKLFKEKSIYQQIRSKYLFSLHQPQKKTKSAVKRRSILGGLDQYTTPNTKLNPLEMSAPPPPSLPPEKTNKQKNSLSLRCHVKFQTQQTHVATKIVTLWNSHTVTVKQSTINSPHWVWRVT